MLVAPACPTATAACRRCRRTGQLSVRCCAPWRARLSRPKLTLPQACVVNGTRCSRAHVRAQPHALALQTAANAGRRSHRAASGTAVRGRSRAAAAGAAAHRPLPPQLALPQLRSMGQQPSKACARLGSLHAERHRIEGQLGSLRGHAAAEAAAGVPGIHAARYDAAWTSYMRLLDGSGDIRDHFSACCALSKGAASVFVDVWRAAPALAHSAPSHRPLPSPVLVLAAAAGAQDEDCFAAMPAQPLPSACHRCLSQMVSAQMAGCSAQVAAVPCSPVPGLAGWLAGWLVLLAWALFQLWRWLRAEQGWRPSRLPPISTRPVLPCRAPHASARVDL